MFNHKLRFFRNMKVVLCDFRKALFTAGIIQLTKVIEFPANTVFANNMMIIDLRLRF